MIGCILLSVARLRAATARVFATARIRAKAIFLAIIVMQTTGRGRPAYLPYLLTYEISRDVTYRDIRYRSPDTVSPLIVAP